MSTTPELFKDFARYNAWANDQILNWLFAQPEELLERETPSSFPTLRLTLLHIWDAQDIWMRRLQGREATNFPSAQFKGSLQEIKTGLQANSAQFSDMIQQCPDPFFSGHIRYKNSKGTEFSTANAEVILHCMQHGTYHRGQIVTMARSLGITDPPQTDYIAFVRVRK